jgi:hypothetical protein
VREAGHAGHVADRPDAVAGPEVLVDRDAAATRIDAGRRDAQGLEVHAPAGRDQQPLAPHRGAVAERHPHAAGRVGGHLGGGEPGAHRDPLGVEQPAELLPLLGLLEREQVRCVLDDRDVGAEAPVHLCELEADRAAAEDHHRGRIAVGLDGLAVRPVRHVGQAGDRRDRRRAAGRDHQAAPRRVPPAVDLDLARADDARAAAHEGLTAVEVALDGDRVVPVAGDLAHTRGHLRPVRRHRPVAGEPDRPRGLGQGVPRAHHHLRRDTAPVRALAADEAAVDAEHVEAGLGRALRHLLAARSQPDDDQVVLGHVRSSSRERSAIGPR